jgi:hypothetical protein
MMRLIALALGGLLLSVGWAAPAVGATGYTMATTAHYVVQPAAGRIGVTVTVEFKNTTPDTGTQISAFDRIELPVQTGASEAKATDGTGALVSGLAVRDGMTVAFVTPRTRIRFGQVSRFTLTFALADLAAPAVHVRPDVVDFVAWGFGTSSAVTIDLPPTLQVHSDGDPLATDAGPVRIRLTSGPIADPTQWLARLTATGPISFLTLTRRVTLASATVELQIRAWATDQAWGDRVAATASQALPLLEAATGMPYPRVGPLVLTESIPASEISEASATTGEIQVGYSASDFTVVHQLAHIWVSPQLTTERWLAEGLASHFAEQIGAALSIDPPYAPEARAAELAADAFPLDAWGLPSTDASRDAYGYAASWAVIDQAARLAGEGNLRRALARGVEGRSAYDPATPTGSASGPPSTPIDSRRLLDQLSEQSGIDLGDLFAARVFAPGAAQELDQRAVARLAYRALLDQAGDWGAPEAIRVAMSSWTFDDALRQLGDARRWMTERDQLLHSLDQVGLTPPDRLRDRYLADGGGPGALAELDAERAVVEAFATAEQRAGGSRGLVERIGLFATDDGPRMLADARTAFVAGDLRTASELVAAVEHRLDGAFGDGLLRVGVALLLLAVLAVVGRRRRRTHYTAAQ